MSRYIDTWLWTHRKRLEVRIRLAADMPQVKGFAVGPGPSFGEPSRQWLGGQLNDEQLIATVKQKYRMYRLLARIPPGTLMPASSRPSASGQGRVPFDSMPALTQHSIDHAVSHQPRCFSQLSDYWHPVSHAAAVRSAAVASEQSVDRYRGRQPPCLPGAPRVEKPTRQADVGRLSPVGSTAPHQVC